MADSPFYLDVHEYSRDINILKHYIDDQASHLSIMTGRRLDECAEFVKAQLRPTGQFAFQDPPILYTDRGPTGDRQLKEGTLHRYLQEAVAQKHLIAPTFTTYLNPKEKQSLLVDFIDDNVAGRGAAKKKMYEARAAGNVVLDKIWDNEQTNRKLSNNAVSGGLLSASQPLYNKTGQPSLTSTCRATSGFGNANNEKLLSGNRHYWSPTIARNNIVSIVNHTDYDAFATTLNDFGVVCPTLEQTVECLKFSTDLYWSDRREMSKLVALLERLTPIQRAAFCYTGDLYHLMRFNDEVARGMIGRLALMATQPHPDPKAALKAIDTAIVETAAQICETFMRGKKHDELSPHEYGIFAATAQNIVDTLEDYRPLIRAFYVTVNVPASLAWFPDSIRRAALISDTDSTIFTVQDWVQWYFGKITVDPKANAVAAVMVLFSSQSIIHILARMSANLGIGPDRLRQIAMKNEYKFDAICPTQLGKHYFALIGCQEGNLYAKYKKEIKGVHLKSSNAPPEVMKQAERMMLRIMETVLAGKKVSLKALLKEVADLERDTFASIARGEPKYLRRGQIKPLETYKSKDPSTSPFLNYLMWEEVFAPDYGHLAPPPYTCVKVNLDTDSKAKTKAWLDGLENRGFAERMATFMAKHNKVFLGTLNLPEQILASTGMPKEVLEAAGARKIVYDTTGVFYIILEALNFFIQTDKNLRLISDYY